MSARGRSYHYVGPVELKAAVRPGSGGCLISSAAGCDAWIAERSAAELTEPFTFVVGTDNALRLAPRRSEHAPCVGGEMVLSAGEISFTREADRWTVGEVSNQSTGHCPYVTSWSAVARALDDVERGQPSGFTHKVVFRLPGAQHRARGRHRLRLLRQRTAGDVERGSRRMTAGGHSHSLMAAPRTVAS